MVTEEQIKEQYDRFMKLISEDSRKENLLKLYDTIGTRIIEAPASMRVYWHNCFPGGYLDHVLRVYDASLQIAKTYKNLGGSLTFNKQELTLATLHHDLGKLGDLENVYYIDQESEWHQKRGERYQMNRHIQFMHVPDRALFLLQHFGVEITQNEWLGIKLSDGLYEEANKSYLKNTLYPYPMHTSLPYIVHMADMMATSVERDQTRINFADDGTM
jgi:hypothetical protein